MYMYAMQGVYRVQCMQRKPKYAMHAMYVGSMQCNVMYACTHTDITYLGT